MTATATEGGFLSREKLAGYDRQGLDEARVVVVVDEAIRKSGDMPDSP